MSFTHNGDWECCKSIHINSMSGVYLITHLIWLLTFIIIVFGFCCLLQLDVEFVCYWKCMQHHPVTTLPSIVWNHPTRAMVLRHGWWKIYVNVNISPPTILKGHLTTLRGTYVVHHHFCLVPVSLFSWECWFALVPQRQCGTFVLITFSYEPSLYAIIISNQSGNHANQYLACNYWNFVRLSGLVFSHRVMLRITVVSQGAI